MIGAHKAEQRAERLYEQTARRSQRKMEYAELGWQEAVVLGCAKQDGVLEAVADGNPPADEVASRLGLSPRSVRALLSALAEMGGSCRGGRRVPVTRRAPRASSGKEPSGLRRVAWSCTGSS